MTTAIHIPQFLSVRPTGLPREDFFRWCHEHPTFNKIIEVAGMIFGGTLMAASLTLSSWTFALIGGSLFFISAIAWKYLEIIAPPRHDMAIHTFSPGRCDGGELYYHGDLPILKIDGRDPRRAGFAQGYLLGEAISQISARFDTALHTCLRRPRAQELEPFLNTVKQTIPENYLREMEGLVEGYNRWVREQSGFFRPKEMALDEAVLFHLMPDSLNLLIEGPFASFLLPQETVGCSSFLDLDSERGVVFGRNMDWPSLGLTGKYSFIKHVDCGDNQRVEVSVPGIIGTLTGMNHFGFSLAMNVCPGEKSNQVRGMPALFYNRYCLERCRTVQDMNALTERPLCAYHLTVADSENGQSHHFYQGEQDRRVLNEASRPLATFNRAFGGDYIHIDQNHSLLRGQLHSDFYHETDGLSRETLMEESLRIPGINNFKTTHTVLMIPQDRQMKVAWDNSFAADSPLHEVPIHLLFSQRESALASVAD